MLGQKTVNALLSLNPSGPQSFEDLLRELLSELTGQPYHLCASGWQGGVDGVTASGSIGFEAKRYGETDLDIRSLQGEIVQAVRERQNLELWILATTGRLGAQDRLQLNNTVENQGVALLTLAEGDMSVPFHPLAGLCALRLDRVCSVLEDPSWQEKKKGGRRKKMAVVPVAEVRAELDEIASSSEFASFRAELQEKVRELPTWKLFVERQNQRVKRAILRSSKVELGTHFDPDKVIPRKTKAEIDGWLAVAKAPQEPPLAAVLGERFDGKTWLVFDWLIDRIDALDLPVFFVGSMQGDVQDRLAQMLRAEVERSLGRYGRHAGALLDLRRRWAAGRTPWCLLILDGLNEYKRADKPWRRHLADAYARTEPDFRPAAVLCTARARSWPDIEQEVRQVAGSGETRLSVGPFDDSEFAEAFRRAGKTPEEIASLPPGAQKLIRRPRFFQLVLEHSDRLGNFEIVNEDVLYWLDASDKLRRDRPGSPARWTEEMYQGVLLDLAKNSIDRHGLKRPDILDILERQTRSEVEVGFEDLISEGVLSKSGLKYSLKPEHLRTGMGLYLLHLLDEASTGQDELRERLRDFLSPFNEDDTAAAWLRRASVFALLSEGVSTDVIDILVDEWLRIRNRPSDDFEHIKAIASLLLHPLLRLAPRTWTRSTGNRGLQELSILLFSESLDRKRGLIQEFFRHWCRFVPANGPSFLEDEPESEERVRSILRDESLMRLGLQARGDSGLLQLQNVVLYLESLSPGLVGPDGLLAIVAAHHIPLYFFSDSGPWILRQAMAGIPRKWFEEWVQIASRDRHSSLAEIVRHLLQLVERADLMDLLSLIELEVSEEEEDVFPNVRSLDRAHYEEARLTPFQEGEKPTRFLIRVRHLVIDPELPFPGDERLQGSLSALREKLSGVELHLHNAPTSEDHLFRDAAAAIAAWMPKEGATIVLRQIEDLPKRFREDNYWWILSIRRHAILAEGPARDHLAAAAATRCPSENGRMAPGYALQALLPGMTSANAVDAILHHHLDFEWSVFYEFVTCLDVDSLRSDCLAVLNEEAPPRKRIRAYHLLAELGAPSLSDAQARLLQRDIEEDNAELRVAALGCAASCNVTGLPPYRLLAIAVDTEEDRKTFGPRNAAWLLIQEGHFLDRLPPYWRALAAVRHPARREQLLQEVEGAFANDTEEAQALPSDYVLPVQHGIRPARHRLSLADDDRSLHIVGPDSTLGGLDDEVEPENLKEFFNQDLYFEKRNRQIQEGLVILRRRQQEHKTAWSYEQFPQELIDDLTPTRFEQWVEAMLQDEKKTWFQWTGIVISLFRRTLRSGHPATPRLWSFVHPFSAERRPGVIRYLDRGIDWVLHELSGSQADDVLARRLLRELVLEARTDRQLFEIALGARCQEPSRLLGVAVELLESQEAEERARAARLLGWLEGTEDRLRELAQADASLWVRRIAEGALKERQRERFARHWLRTFMLPDLPREQRWGAGQLFLETVDGCFQAWAYAFVRETAPDIRVRGEAMLLLDAAHEEVKQRRLDSLEKHFLGTKVSDLESGCHPWQRRRTWREIEQKF